MMCLTTLSKHCLILSLAWGLVTSTVTHDSHQAISSSANSSARRNLSELSPSSPSYYNQLRIEVDASGTGYTSANYSNVYKVQVPNSTLVYRLAELKSFI